MLSIRKILYPTDFSECSRPAFELACALARDYGAEIVILHVAQLPLLTPIDGVFVPTVVDDTERAREQLELVSPTDPRITVTHRLVEGDPAIEINRLAGEAKIDLIVLGTHGRGGFGRLLMGSVAERVVRGAPCPVVTMKTSAAVGRTVTPLRNNTEQAVGHSNN